MKPNIDIVTIPVKNLGEAALFYKKIFKLEEDNISEGENHIAILFRNNLSLVLCEIESFAEMTDQDVETISTASLILSQNVEKRETVDSIILSASEHGGKIISKGKADEWGYSAIFKDLDDVTWELITWNEITKRRMHND
ncbi:MULTISPECIES: VOC family protein [Jeotgalicoccus]|uniref:VOC family protein n=1 Tax=Jeotgalicoccus TaxID=227979 RepID=UPI00040E32AB|nr:MULTISPECIES: hypothetical protein [Jeotgalicoccus]QQD85061.1 hypothetical protein JEM45_10780 [Jeotgalicoccus sp. ATCC 8456]